MNTKLKLLAAVAIIAIASTSAGGLYMANQTNITRFDVIRVACVGDSITASSEYPDDLQAKLGANYLVGNFGVNGSTVTTDSWSPYSRQPEFQSAKDFQPNIVILMLGTNAGSDLSWSEADFKADYLSLVHGFQALSSKPQVWIVKPPPIYADGAYMSLDFFDGTIIPAIEDIAVKANLPVINVYGALAGHAEYFFDGVHPNPKGAQAIADTIYAAILPVP